ncbi:hypothetical protein [Rummeliibacillus sp. SL167]|uniref:hypothetical protein n=1 Tax=Rummeliibacillus sp. SL167 TaxID=2579792 RepID=UPI00351A3F42
MGLRVSDLVPLTVQEVRGKTHLVITEQKTKKMKRFLIPRATREMIEDYTRDMSLSAWLFLSQKGNSQIAIFSYFHHTRPIECFRSTWKGRHWHAYDAKNVRVSSLQTT